MTTGVVLDAGAFVALENRDRTAVAMFDQARQTGRSLITSAAVLGRIWRGQPQQANIARVLKWSNFMIDDLTRGDGRTIGKMLAVTGTTDVIDAHAALLARRSGWPVVTSDPGDLRKLDPTLTLWQV